MKAKHLPAAFLLAALNALVSLLSYSSAYGADSSLMETLEKASPASIKNLFKGTEVYSWKDNGKLVFTILPGTNRIKFADEIKNPKMSVKNVEQLGLYLSKFAPGAEIFIVDNLKNAPCELARLPESMTVRLNQFAHAHGLKLIVFSRQE